MQIEPEKRIELAQQHPTLRGTQALASHDLPGHGERARRIEIVPYRVPESLPQGFELAHLTVSPCGAQLRGVGDEPVVTGGRGFDRFIREGLLLAVVGLQAEVPKCQRSDSTIDQVVEYAEIPDRFRHLLTAKIEKLAVEPEPHPRMDVVRRFALCDLIGVMNPDVIDAPAVNIELVSEIFSAHRRALDVPSRKAAPPRRIPLLLPQRTGCGKLPERKVGGIALARNVADAPSPDLGFEIKSCKLRVAGKFRDVEIDAVFDSVTETLLFQHLDQRDLLGNVFGRLAQHFG